MLVFDYARWIAEVEDTKCGGTIYLILLLLEGGVITKREAREIIDGIIEKGWFCSTELYARILKRLEEELFSSNSYLSWLYDDQVPFEVIVR